MAPPDRGDTPRDTGVLAQAGIAEDSNMRHSAEELASWLEFLLHPEEHEYDRTVIYGTEFGGPGHKKEEPGPVAPTSSDQPGTVPSDAQLPFESVLEGYHVSQFIHGMSAVGSPVVESPTNALAPGAATLHNIWWIGGKGIPSLVDQFQQLGWEGDASKLTFDFLLRLQTVAAQVHLLAEQLHPVVPKYAVIIKGVRHNLKQAADAAVAAFEKKFAEKPETDISIDWGAAILAGIAAAAVTYVTAGGGIILISAMTSAWSTAFTDAAGDLLKPGDGAPVTGTLWRDLAHSYLDKQAEILTAGKNEIDQLNRTVQNALDMFNSDPDIQQFIKDFGAET
ncbi:MAG: hypothetical protein ACRDSK_11730 [Actinophytocola sp.]|uniref:hypothetical protein n=1 Tax=Actinophytocola sp. TaxID=1872138 RepID=UPI003D6A4768